jgi:hypothetical protein
MEALPKNLIFALDNVVIGERVLRELKSLDHFRLPLEEFLTKSGQKLRMIEDVMVQVVKAMGFEQ